MCKFILAAFIGTIFVVALIFAIFNILHKMSSSRKSLNDKLDSIDPTKTSYQIIKNIDTDEKYFKNETGKAEFNKLSIDDMRKKKVYYESGYKLTKGETESDLTKYLGGKKPHEALINNIKDVIESYKLMYILTALSAAAIIILIFIFVSLKKAGEQKLADQANKVQIEMSVKKDSISALVDNDENAINKASDVMEQGQNADALK